LKFQIPDCRKSMTQNLKPLSTPSENDETLLQALTAEKARRRTENKLQYYEPYKKQREFHNAGRKHRERLLMAANQVGKTFAVAMELAMHATGAYPDWWHGYKFDRAIRAWACGETSEVVRATIQLLLLGEPGQHGTGCIPKSALVEVVPARGLADLVDTIRVQHASGDVSTLSLKAYSQGRERFQGATIDYLWLDEEPDSEIFSEALTRTNIAAGPAVLTFTPLKGMSTVVKRYLHDHFDCAPRHHHDLGRCRALFIRGQEADCCPVSRPRARHKDEGRSVYGFGARVLGERGQAAH
jgi:phage terminase large subunit-like protein